MNLAQAIKKCSLDAWEAQVPCDMFLGVITGVEPVTVKVGGMEIPKEILYVPEHLLYKEQVVTVGLYREVVVINEGLKEGDCVVLVRKNGGSGYTIVGKLQEG